MTFFACIYLFILTSKQPFFILKRDDCIYEYSKYVYYEN
jgi:hypothetical protein